jgi:hypothetical protein
LLTLLILLVVCSVHLKICCLNPIGIITHEKKIAFESMKEDTMEALNETRRSVGVHCGKRRGREMMRSQLKRGVDEIQESLWGGTREGREGGLCGLEVKRLTQWESLSDETIESWIFGSKERRWQRVSEEKKRLMKIDEILESVRCVLFVIGMRGMRGRRTMGRRRGRIVAGQGCRGGGGGEWCVPNDPRDMAVKVIFILTELRIDLFEDISESLMEWWSSEERSCEMIETEKNLWKRIDFVLQKAWLYTGGNRVITWRGDCWYWH